ncbi:uncharacterized protein LOC129981108 [Argiope bruennichi]|uniref:Peptidase inhibitor 16 like protein n=1 Tax=Argiope bruennichi TaxID=94029 RepID=A0A8T0FXX8_ARGBR|nr:uncharacterized protein LOC129981108 [Argiope bruennichi]KAF8795937.1 Peptidase inhibitor 16 like protein [Argiope bruennichi]
MEKYCTITILVWLGLPLFCRSLIFLESDESLNIDSNDRISAILQNRDYPSPSYISTGDYDSIKTRSLNTEEKYSGKEDEIILTGFGHNNDYHDYPLSSQISTNSHELIKRRSLNTEENSDGKESETISSDFEDNNDYHDYPSSSHISANSHESLNTNEKSSGKDDEMILPGFENNNDYHDYPLENLIAGDGHEMVESDPVVEDIPEDIELVYQMNKKRHVPDRGFTEETRKMMLDLHNVYRGNVTPPAGNMNFLVWDESLEELAQLWADNCVFAHGRPPNTSYYFDGKVKPYGQNLYLGTDPSGYKGLWMWYEEYMHYELRNQTCKPNEQCGHYVQMAWAESKRLGCGIKLCGMRYLIVCHYYPGALKDVQMYHVGRPCSLCDEEEGALCKNKLCVSHELCKENPKFCESATCNLKCQNCGRLNKTSCHCTCADGWDSPDCSKPCADNHERCGRKPGFPHKASCSIQNYAVAKKYCRKMCDTCVSVTNDTTVNHLCCDGSLCQKGYVLDLERKPCRCTLLCPGPLCDYMDDSSSVLNYSLTFLISQILVIYFINHTRHSL